MSAADGSEPMTPGPSDPGSDDAAAAGAGSPRGFRDRTARLSIVMYHLQGPMVIAIALWTFVVRTVFFQGWMSAFYLILFLPAMIVLQLVIWGATVFVVRRSRVKRMNGVTAWSYLAYLVCALILPTILPDTDDQRDMGGALALIGLDLSWQDDISMTVFCVGFTAIAATGLGCLTGPIELEPAGAGAPQSGSAARPNPEAQQDEPSSPSP